MPELLTAGEVYCSECDQRRATHLCDQCGDPYCVPCFDASHFKGKKKDHTRREWGKAGEGSGWEELFDDETRKYVYFNSISKETTYEKPVELMWGKELEEYKELQAGSFENPHIFVPAFLQIH